jgi:hypothetical protein
MVTQNAFVGCSMDDRERTVAPPVRTQLAALAKVPAFTGTIESPSRMILLASVLPCSCHRGRLISARTEIEWQLSVCRAQMCFSP